MALDLRRGDEALDLRRGYEAPFPPRQVNDSNILLRLSLRARIMMERENLKGGPLMYVSVCTDL